MHVLFLFLAQISLGMVLYFLGQDFWLFVLLMVSLCWAALVWRRDRESARLESVPELSTSEFVDIVYEKRFGSKLQEKSD